MERKWLVKAAGLRDVAPRFNLGGLEFESGNYKEAMLHFLIAASFGSEDAVTNILLGFKDGHVSKDDLAFPLRSFQSAEEEMQSDDRDLAKVMQRLSVSR